MSIEPEIILPLKPPFVEKPDFLQPKKVTGKVVGEEPLARGFGTVTDKSMIGREKVRISQWEASIEKLKKKIERRKNQIRNAKKRIKLHEKASTIPME